MRTILARARRRAGRGAPRWAPGAAVAVACLCLAACGGAPSHSGTPSSGSTLALEYAQCMRSHGVSDFPDPNSQGGFSLPGDVDPTSPQYEAATKACQKFAGHGLDLSPAKQEQIEARALKYAQCMRSHGLPNYPDPTITFSNGGVSQGSDLAGSGIDPSSPAFQSAQKACQGVQGGQGG